MLSENNLRSASSLAQQGRSQQAHIYLQSEDSVGQGGECAADKRMYEAFCTVCHVLVCPSCVMFGAHKGHSVTTMEEASRNLRRVMDEASKTGVLKIDRTENVLVDIRHTKLTCEEAKQRALKEVEATFQAIFKLIKQRKDDITREVNAHFDFQITAINEQERIWVDKQDRAYELIKMGKNPNDYSLIERAPFVLESLDLLRQSPTYKNVHIVNAIDATFTGSSGQSPQQSVSLNLNEFKKSLEKWVKLGDPVLIQFKC